MWTSATHLAATFSTRVLRGCALCQWLPRRHLTANQTAAALRPFYFAVHPDLFGQHPQERATNESSLKQLSAYMEGLHSRRQPPPTHLYFYVRPTLPQQLANIRRVKIPLSSRNVQDTVRTILSCCDLSLDFVDKLPAPSTTDRPIKWDPSFYTFYGIPDPDRRNVKPRPTVTLNSWLHKNLKRAQGKFEATRGVRDETRRLSKDVCKTVGVVAVHWSCGWRYSQFCACLHNLLRLYELHQDIHLQGETLEFGSETGVTLSGHVMLRSDEVGEAWVRFLQRLQEQKQILKELPRLERKLSALLNNVTVVRRHRASTVLAKNYRLHLRRLIAALQLYIEDHGTNNLCQPLSHVQLLVEGANGPVSLSPGGQVSVPASCPAFLVIDFLNSNAEKSSEILQVQQRFKVLERTAMKQCKHELKLRRLSKDVSVSPEQMTDCCSRLLNDHVGLSLDGTLLRVTQFYSVMSDGEICIPWNWRGPQDAQ